MTDLRVRLDDAITYGSTRQAMKLARYGAAESRRLSIKGEEEYFKGEIEMLKENYASAIDDFDAAIKLNPKDGGAYNDKALALAELGFLDKALACFDQGIAVEPDYANIYHNKGWLLNNIGRHTEAIICLKKALALERDRAVTYDNLADAYFNLGDYQAARRAYGKVLELLKPGQCRSIRRQIKEQIRFIEEKSKKEQNEYPHDSLER
jgi:tetratricopeptide (TPR) repeat protein